LQHQKFNEDIQNVQSRQAENNRNLVDDLQTVNRRVESLTTQIEDVKVPTRQNENLSSLVEMLGKQVEDLGQKIEEIKMDNSQVDDVKNQMLELRIRLVKSNNFSLLYIIIYTDNNSYNSLFTITTLQRSIVPVL